MQNKVDTIYQKLKKNIMSGMYQPAENLTEAMLAAQMEASRNTIKKALLMLEKEQLVIIEQNKSARIRVFSLEEILNLLEIRETLESLIIRKAMPFITEEHILSLEKTLAQMKQDFRNGRFMEYSGNNQVFHQTIYKACPNQTAVTMALTMKNQISRYDVKTILIPNRGQVSLMEHEAILEAIRRRDADEAANKIALHIRNIRKTLLEHYTILL